MDEYMNGKEVVLDKVRYCYSRAIYGLLDERDVMVEVERDAHDLRARIEAKFWGKRLPVREKEFTTPRTWFDHFLMTFARNWIVAFLTRKGWVRRPQMTVTKITFEETAVWPDLKADPFNGKHLVVRVCDMTDYTLFR